VLDFDGRLVGYIPRRNSEEVLWGDFLEEIVPRLKGQGRIRHPWLGLEVTELNPDVLEHLDRPSGLLLSAVFFQGPGWIAGARAGDLLIEINGQAVRSPEGYRGILAALSIGTSCELKVVRKGREITLKAPVMGRSEQKRLEAGGEWIPLLGASLKAERGAAVSEGVQASGLRVTYLEREGLAFAAGIRDDDLLLSVDGRPVATPARLKRLLRKSKPSLIELVRGNRQLLVLLEIPKTHEAP
jgi:serine protease Do